ncbi:uncharacterized protein LOC126737833 [Anthonomus grandis grandis]|uniref:uncharacterized protein LOC126737833 n=1 Tax=Anthonomus grandis grandis TaxID=2921223 RepID=UPI002166B4A3|nr:uncharacterized protein LOC126737833 [Anthonomus grandis grandis]
MSVQVVDPPAIKYDKIKKVLNKFLQPDFKVKNDVYLNLFLTHLAGKQNDNKCSLIKTHKDHLSQWLIDATNLWRRKPNILSSTIMSFALNLASELSTDEEIFVKLNGQNIFETLIGIAQENLKQDPSVILGIVTLLCSFLEHKSGLQWVLATNSWTEYISLGMEAHTMYIRKKVYQLTALLLEKTVSFNKNFCVNLVATVVQPLHDVYKNFPSLESNQPPLINNSLLFETLQPSLLFISEVLELLVNRMQGCVLNLFVAQQTVEITKKLLLVSQIEDFSYELLKIRIALLFTNQCPMKLKKHEGDNTLANFDFLTIFHVIKDEMNKNHVKCVIKICHFAQTVYCNLAEKVPLCIRKGVPIEFQNQMLLFQLIPIVVFLSKKRNLNLEVLMHDVFRREFYQKIIKMSAWEVIDSCYRWKPMLLEKSNLIDDLTFGLQYMIKTKKMLNKERATIFFQPLVYCLKDMLYIMNIEQQQGINYDMKRYSKFIETLMETIIDLVESFDLTWKDSIETISVLSMACEFLQYNHWEQKTVVTALRLLNLSIAKYMSPEMVLLMVKPEDSIVGKTGKLLYTKCHDSSWEVRDTALENILTVSSNAVSMFPSYRTILIDAEFPHLVFQMALNDGEYYVRATAFRCLQEMIQVQEIWEKLMDIGELEQIINVLINETEGVVRKEAALLLYKINRHQCFPKELQPRIYDVMTHAAIADLHWEVKCNAVDFWFSVFHQHLTEQGMIDCGFPDFTFSKEHKKIVNLTESEVRKRLIIALNQLARIGCLYVLKYACLEDCDLEVSKKACDKVAKLAELLKKYQVPCDDIDEIQTSESMTDVVMDPSTSATVRDNQINSRGDEVVLPYDLAKVDSIIDELLNSNDNEFLKNLYNPNDQLRNPQIQLKKSTYLSPSEFCKFIYNDVENHSSEKSQWLHSLHEFDSLLDDILKEYNIPNVNSMDCY